MPDKTLELEDLTQTQANVLPDARLHNSSWLPVVRHSCEFSLEVFESVSSNLIKNPNINSSLLFRADILYDSAGDEVAENEISEPARNEILQKFNVGNGEFEGYEVKRTILRRMIPRNPQLDRPVAQTCLFLRSTRSDIDRKGLVIYIPHCTDVDHLPWYHPRVKALAYLYYTSPMSQTSDPSQGTVSLHYQLFPGQTLPLSDRLLRTGKHLLSTIYRHGQGRLHGYQKRVQHDQIISQQRVQNTYTELKQKHARRLCDNWVEKTEPSKHVFEDLGIAAFLIELWRDMYQIPGRETADAPFVANDLPLFPGFVDIGCGNGVLVDVLLREGYRGWGFDVRERKTWSTFSPEIRIHLEKRVLVPQPLLEMKKGTVEGINLADAGLLSNLNSQAGQLSWHNGIFPAGTFIISNHADELTPWTPLLASISDSPLLAIPCCSHNLSGSRFRAPSHFNNYSADALAPLYFAANIRRSKSVAITVACPDNNFGIEEASEEPDIDTSLDTTGQKKNGAQQGDLKSLTSMARAKQPSAYSSLCDWVQHLATQVGFEVERETLRLPSTRNIGLVCRGPLKEYREMDPELRFRLVLEIARQEKADGELWISRANSLMSTASNTGKH